MESKFEINHIASAPNGRHLPLAQALALLPSPQARPRSAAVYQHGSLLVKLFSPVEIDSQQPHTQDELYIVASGSGWFVNGSERHRFAEGDALFVPAGVVHRFEEFSPDLVLWVVFYGAQGGEKP
jgi:mannose-6-phosphate isomerase-like protein (cupin superfamily)